MKIRVTLLYQPSEDKGKYGEAFTEDYQSFFEIDSRFLLPIGTEINMTDTLTKKSVNLVVTKWHLELDEDLLCLVVTTAKSIEILPMSFWNISNHPGSDGSR